MRRSIILDTTARLVFPSALTLSLYLLFAGARLARVRPRRDHVLAVGRRRHPPTGAPEPVPS